MQSTTHILKAFSQYQDIDYFGIYSKYQQSIFRLFLAGTTFRAYLERMRLAQDL